MGNHIIIPFVTHSGGGSGNCFSDVAELCINCTVDTDGWSSWLGGGGRRLRNWINQKLNTWAPK